MSSATADARPRESSGTVWRDPAGAIRRFDRDRPGVLPVALGVGALVVIGVIEWPLAVGGAAIYAAYQWWRSDSPPAAAPDR